MGPGCIEQIFNPEVALYVATAMLSLMVGFGLCALIRWRLGVRL